MNKLRHFLDEAVTPNCLWVYEESREGSKYKLHCVINYASVIPGFVLAYAATSLSPGKALTLKRIDFSSSGAHVLIDIDIARYHGQPTCHLVSTNRCVPVNQLGQFATRWRCERSRFVCPVRATRWFPKFTGFSRKKSLRSRRGAARRAFQ